MNGNRAALKGALNSEEAYLFNEGLGLNGCYAEDRPTRDQAVQAFGRVLAYRMIPKRMDWLRGKLERRERLTRAERAEWRSLFG